MDICDAYQLFFRQYKFANYKLLLLTGRQTPPPINVVIGMGLKTKRRIFANKDG